MLIYDILLNINTQRIYLMTDQLPDKDSQQRFRDLESEIKRLDKELQKTKDRAQNSERIRSTFLTNMSHAVRTPMNAIIGFSELIAMDTVSPEKKKEFTRIINEKGHQLLTLIDDFIELSKIESGKIELSYTEFDIDDFLNELFSSTLQKKLKAGKDFVEIALERNVNEGLLVHTDSGRLQQIFNNILSFSISNTIKGSIRFGYDIKDQKNIEFFVSDTGIGLSKDEQKVIFEYFWEAEGITNKLAGSGLGLTIAKNLVELLGGKLSINSDPKKGTEFTFTLPVEKPGKVAKISHQSPAKVSDAEKLDYNWKNKVILVVEDDLVNYQFIEALLERSQVQLLHAEDGNQALELCKTINKIDLILMDIKLPDKNGYQITREIKAIRNDVPIVAQTAFSINEVKEKCISSGCEDVVSKPVEIELFLSTIDKYISVG